MEAFPFPFPFCQFYRFGIIKDIVNFESVRENIFLGYGLVVGLKNTGNTPFSSHFMPESLVSM
jgi:flagellar P-ring protein precursor FlgI